MAQFLLNPTITNLGAFDQMTFPVGPINKFIASEVFDTMDFYQTRFGVFGSLVFNVADLEYKIHTQNILPFLWQKDVPCQWSPMHGLETSMTSIKAEKLMLNAEHCYDDTFDSVFKYLIEWKTDDDNAQLDDSGVAAINDFIQKMFSAATFGLRATIWAAGYEAYQNGAFDAMNSTAANLQQIWGVQIASYKGILQGLIDDALANPTTLGHYNVTGLLDADIAPALGANPMGRTRYVGDVVELFETMRDSAPTELADLISSDGVLGMGSQNSEVIWLVSPSIVERASKQYGEESTGIVQQNRRLTCEKVPVEGSNRTVKMYYVDGIPLIPQRDQEVFGKNVRGTLHFGFITFAGNIQFGGSFSELPRLGNGIGLAVQRQNDLREAGKVLISSKQLVAGAIANSNYFVGTQLFKVA